MPISDGSTRPRASDTPVAFPRYSDVQQFIALISGLQFRANGAPVVISPAEIASVTGIPETEQVTIRQHLMLAGRLRLDVQGGRWAYSLVGGAA